MKFAISGTQCTGKTTLLDNLSKDIYLSKYYRFYGNITRGIREKGININEAGGDFSQILVMAKHVEHSLYDDVILDRCALDGIVYTLHLYEKGLVSDYVKVFAFNVYEAIIDRYDKIFYLVPEFDIVDDGIRSVDKQFQIDIKSKFDYFIENNPERFNNKIVRVSGNGGTRLAQVKNSILQTEKEKGIIR